MSVRRVTTLYYSIIPVRNTHSLTINSSITFICNIFPGAYKFGGYFQERRMLQDKLLGLTRLSIWNQNIEVRGAAAGWAPRSPELFLGWCGCCAGSGRREGESSHYPH